MEPMDYVRIVGRRWKLLAGLAVVGLVLGYLAGPAPEKPQQVAAQGNGTTLYAASEILAGQPLSAGTAALVPSVNAIAVVTQSPTIAQKVATDIGYKGDPTELASQILVS